MKNRIGLILVCIVGLVVFCWVRDFIIKNVITVVATNVTGAPVHIGGFSLSVIGQSVKITDFKMYNPQGFPRDTMVDIPLMKISSNIFPAFFGKIHIRQLTPNLQEM